MDVEIVALKADMMALKFVILSLTDALPEVQRAAVCKTIEPFATASVSHNVDFPVFSIGEGATKLMNDSMKQIVGLVAQFLAIGPGSKAEGPPVR
jgi:hypothetical protein